MIDCIHIGKIYSHDDIETVALKDISFQVQDGEFVAIIGPSGSGKSTLMHILGALDTPTSGEYWLDGKNVSLLSDNELADIRKKKIGFVFQSFNLLPRVTALQNVMLPLMYTQVPRAQRLAIAKESLNKVGFDENRFSHYSNQLSGGQMQRVAIARSLVNNPSLILADEPTGNLDSHTGEVVLKTLQDLNQKHHRTIILITHDSHIAAHAKRIITIQDGAITSDAINTNLIFA
ncbi:MAG TPA: ABC transporter ATP-binding protein [Candidatus Paceibacterota bacterium]|nr:ABC transporter ATP-binding protein [Candidatus Paceibacterota bacterium]